MADATDGKVLFREEQRFNRGWLFAIMVAGEVIGLGGIAYVLLVLVPADSVLSPLAKGLILAASVVAPAVVLGLTFLTNMTTEVREDGLFVRYFPLHRSPRRIPLEDVTVVEAVTYRPVMEYGGWGIRRTRGGKAYNVRGNRGVKLRMGDGRHLLIGSARPEELAAAIEELRRRG
ncbi:MAG: DUF6141 family protein [Planctomycetota bacterium]|nr:DUF6141 family protein [Planctomycetota bacterium]